MKLASAIEEFIQYKRALGNLYIGPANILKAFLRKTGDLDMDALTSGHCEAFLPVKGGRVTNFWFQQYAALDRFFRYATDQGYMWHRVLPTSMPDRPPRFIPYIYSPEDIHRLLGVPDSHYSRSCPLSPDTMRTFRRGIVIGPGGIDSNDVELIFLRNVLQHFPAHRRGRIGRPVECRPINKGLGGWRQGVGLSIARGAYRSAKDPEPSPGKTDGAACHAQKVPPRIVAIHYSSLD